MELVIRSIGKVDFADIFIDSVSVIAGYNGSGKTTISKCLYGMLELLGLDKVDENVVKDYTLKLFSGQMTTFGRDALDHLQIIDGDEHLSLLRVGSHKLEIDKTVGKKINVVYLRSPSRWSDSFSDQLRQDLTKPLLKDADSLLDEYRSILDYNASGYLKKTDHGYVYVDQDFPDCEISLDNTASGVMIFLELSRLIGNGTLTPNSVLIIDEPETNLHPEKQVALARMLVALSKKFNIKMFLSSHNIYFIRALEVALGEEELAEYHFYSMKKDKDTRLFSAVDVTENLEVIYNDLYSPMEDL